MAGAGRGSVDQQAINLTKGQRQTEAAARAICCQRREICPAVVRLLRRCFIETGRRTRPMVCFVNVRLIDRIIYSTFHGFNLEWKTRAPAFFHKWPRIAHQNGH